MKRRKKVTLADVARAAGCSVSVASRALSKDVLQNSCIAHQTVQRVSQLAQEMGYQPPRSYAKQRAIGVVGVFMPENHSNLALDLLTSISQTAQQMNTPIHCYSNADSESYRQFIRRYSELHQALGVVSYYPTDEKHLPAFMEMYEFLKKKDAPMVIIHSNAPKDFPAVSVQIDSYYGGRLAGERLAGHRCRKNFLFGCSYADYRWQRIQGCSDVFREKKLNYNIFDTISDIRGDALLAYLQDVEKLIDFRQDAPVGIFAESDFRALAIMNYFQSKGAVIGRDLLIMGYDGMTVTGYTLPGLSTIYQPFAEMGQLAMQKLFNMMKGQTETSALIKPQLIIRGSC